MKVQIINIEFRLIIVKTLKLGKLKTMFKSKILQNIGLNPIHSIANIDIICNH